MAAFQALSLNAGRMLKRQFAIVSLSQPVTNINSDDPAIVF
jgi:hypothetical protein